MTTLFRERCERARVRRGIAGVALCLARRIARPRSPARPAIAFAASAHDADRTEVIPCPPRSPRIFASRFARSGVSRSSRSTVILTLAIGVGATTAVFSVVNSAVLRPVPFRDADRIVSIVEASPRFGLIPFAPPYLRDFRDRASQFDGIAGFTSSWTLTLTGAGQPETVTSAYISDGLLDLFGIVPASGRAFTADEQKPGAGRWRW